jgi:hypothetical protein
VADDALKASWRRTTGHLVAASASLDLSAADRRAFQQFLDANELGLALDMLVESGERAPMPAAAWRELNAAADEMRIEQSDPVHGLSARWLAEHRPM